jgi:hypothetical protein
MSPLINEHAIRRHVGGNTHRIKPYPEEAVDLDEHQSKRTSGRIGMHWRNKCGVTEILMEGKYLPHIKKKRFGTQAQNLAPLKLNLRGDTNQRGAHGHNVWLTRGATPPFAEGGATSLTEGRR